jgi:DNA-binding HxlR family transcriptional regulator
MTGRGKHDSPCYRIQQANRLKLLVEYGLVKKRFYQNNPVRYEYYLAGAGKGLLPVVQSMAVWAKKHIIGMKVPEFKGSIEI